MMLYKELVDELPTVTDVHRYVPGRRHDERERGSPGQAPPKILTWQLASQDEKQANDREWKNDADKAFGEDRKPDKKVERREPYQSAADMEDKEADQCCSHRKGQND